METFEETDVSRAILDAYHAKFTRALRSDVAVSYTHLRAHETLRYLVCRLLLEFTADAMELASALCLKALHAGALLLNLMMAEDLCVHAGRVTGIVANRTMLGESLPIDPIVFASKAAIDATGHEAALANCLQRRGLLNKSLQALPGEGPMDAPAGEQFVVDHVTELYPGLWTTGMTVCASMGGPRMGAIFGGMLRSGAKVADELASVFSKLDDSGD